MKLDPQAYADLADAVGERHVSQDDSVLASYSWNTGLGNMPGREKLSRSWPSAVVLPDSTEQVQAIVRACNRHGVAFRAFSTGQTTATWPKGPMLYVDLRRMDRLHSIDEKNQMAVIEPYVTVHRLQAEAMKKRLTCHIVGAGPGHSPLASAAANFGIGITGQTTGHNARNLLAFEWVTPQGEVFRAGSAGAGVGWFTGEGPGPGFRGMLRGTTGTQGGLGIFTRIGYKLYPWKGPSALGWVGEHPQLRMPLPPNFRVYHAAWETWEAAAAAATQFNIAAVTDSLLRVPPDSIGHIVTGSNEEYVARHRAGTLPEVATIDTRRSWTLLASGDSPAEIEYKDRVVRSVIGRTGGRLIELAPEHQELLLLFLVNSCYVHRVFRPAPGNITAMGVLDSFALLPRAVAAAESLTQDGMAPGGPYINTNPEQAWIWSTEGRHMWIENLPLYRGFDMRSYAAALGYFLRMIDTMFKRSLGVNALLVVPPLMDLYGAAMGHPTRWMRRIRRIFDPKELSGPNNFVTSKPTPGIGLWPVLRAIVYSRPMAPVLRAVTRLMVKAPN
jgi:glycolate oxidase